MHMPESFNVYPILSVSPANRQQFLLDGDRALGNNQF